MNEDFLSFANIGKNKRMRQIDRLDSIERSKRKQNTVLIKKIMKNNRKLEKESRKINFQDRDLRIYFDRNRYMVNFINDLNKGYLNKSICEVLFGHNNISHSRFNHVRFTKQLMQIAMECRR